MENKKPTALHIGCGPIIIRDNEYNWINIDRAKHHSPDICIDVKDLLLYVPENSVDVIWTCHMLEHLPYPDAAEKFLADCLTTLKKGCIMRIAVPDLRLVARYYLNREKELKEIYGDGKFYYRHDNGGERFNYFMRAWEHIVTYDNEMLGDICQGVGFKLLGQKGFNQSMLPEWHYDRYPLESIYYEVIK